MTQEFTEQLAKWEMDMQLIDVNRLKQYIGDCKCCEKCPNKNQKQYECYYNCKFPDYLTEEWERVLDEQPTVEAIPIKWLEEKLTGHPELSYVITDGINNVLELWKAEQERNRMTDKEWSEFVNKCRMAQEGATILERKYCEGYDNGYKDGLKDAWELARKACLYRSSKDGMDWIDERRECFGKTDTYDILHMTVYEAKAKYDAWIDKQEKQNG